MPKPLSTGAEARYLLSLAIPTGAFAALAARSNTGRWLDALLVFFLASIGAALFAGVCAYRLDQVRLTDYHPESPLLGNDTEKRSTPGDRR